MSFIKSTSIITDIAITVPNLSGGTNGRVVRINGSNSVANASYTDTVSQLNTILIKQGDVYYASGVVSGFSGLLVGSAYFLSNDGNITENAPTPTSSIKALYIGFAINETDLIFRPGIPIAGN
jgi:hypothetical protein